MKKLKILIITGIFPPNIDRPATYVSQIVNFLAKHGHKITIFALSESLDYAHNRKNRESAVE